MRDEDAWKALYGEGVRDLTIEGLAEALRLLRRRDSKMAQRVARTIDPALADLFPRRRRAWQDTSVGLRARLELLRENPHVQKDVAEVRRVLGISDGHVRVSEGDPLWKDVWGLRGKVKPGAEKKVIEGNLVGFWINLHRATARGQTLELTLYDILPGPMQESAMASAKVSFPKADGPDWLRRPPGGPEPYNDRAAPLDWAAGRLVERHRLSWSTASPLAFYILTLDSSWITDRELMQVEIRYDAPFADPEAFTVVVRGIDEFTTREDWDRVWERHVTWRQECVWEERGTKPQGRRSVDIGRLKEAMPLYRDMIQKNLAEKDVLGRPHGLRGQPLDQKIEDRDQESIRRDMRDLRVLLTPLHGS